MFTKSIDILSNELWRTLHSETGDGIVSTRNYTHPPKTGYAVDIHVLHVHGRLDPQSIRDWVVKHRLGIDYVPNAYMGAHRSVSEGDQIFEVHVFGDLEAASLFAERTQASYIYNLKDVPELLALASEEDPNALLRAPEGSVYVCREEDHAE